jgi:hypothetical protein
MQTDVLIENLVGDLTPVRPPSRQRDLLALAGLLLVQGGLFALLNGPRTDFAVAMATPAFWWKAASLASVAGLATTATILSLDPGQSAQSLSRLMQRLGVAAMAALALGWLIDALFFHPTPLLTRLDWREGLDCLVNITILTLPLAVLFGVLVRRGASARPELTSTLAGLASAGLAALVFALHCPHDDPLYVVIWYGGAIAAIAGLGRMLARFARW